jgi:hypothetical protein
LTVRELALDEEKMLQVRVYELKLTAPLVKTKLPVIDKFAPNARSTVLVSIVTPEQADPAAVVQVPVPELASKITASEEVGAEAPAAPPVVADQFAVELASQVPEPPTQKRFAIFLPFNHV